ncbi:MAG: hypothetical protein GOU99_03590, partial [Candidatus Altiarchaeota archaeon]|nr:hypothetical protein [Candidatus Altiarchaeota archaeon]
SVIDLGAVYQVTTEYQGNQIPVFATKDGKYLSLELLDMAQQIQQTPNTATLQIETRDTPVAHAFVMSYCPYGLQFLKAYVPVMELLGDKADIQVNFVSYAMHGEKELIENNRMYCIQAEQPELFTDYLRCFIAEGKSDECRVSVGIDQTALDTCIAELDAQYNITGLYNDQTTWSGGRYPQYPVEAQLNAQYSVGGSPTFVLNDVSVSVTRTPEGIKQAICAGFTDPPAECYQTLSTAAEAAGLGPIGSGTTETTDAAQCG